MGNVPIGCASIEDPSHSNGSVANNQSPNIGFILEIIVAIDFTDSGRKKVAADIFDWPSVWYINDEDPRANLCQAVAKVRKIIRGSGSCTDLVILYVRILIMFCSEFVGVLCV